MGSFMVGGFKSPTETSHPHFCTALVWHTAISINVVGLKLQAKVTRPNSNVDRTTLLLRDLVLFLLSL